MASMLVIWLVILCFCVLFVCFWLSVLAQSIAWKDTSLKRPDIYVELNDTFTIPKIKVFIRGLTVLHSPYFCGMIVLG